MTPKKGDLLSALRSTLYTQVPQCMQPYRLLAIEECHDAADSSETEFQHSNFTSQLSDGVIVSQIAVMKNRVPPKVVGLNESLALEALPFQTWWRATCSGCSREPHGR